MPARDLGLRHIRTRPYTPKTNGKAERFIQTALARMGLRHEPTDTQITSRRAAHLAPPIQLASPAWQLSPKHAISQLGSTRTTC